MKRLQRKGEIVLDERRVRQLLEMGCTRAIIAQRCGVSEALLRRESASWKRAALVVLSSSD